MIDLREYKKKPDKITDVLPWAAMVAPEVILNKDGSFQATISYRGPDLDSSTPEELVVNAAHLNNILRRLGAGWAIFAEAQRRVCNQYPESDFPEPISALIDSRRREQFYQDSHFESAYYLTFVYLPPAERTNKVVGIFLSTQSQNDGGMSYERLLESFRDEISRIADLISRFFPEVKVLKEGEVLTYLHGLISPKYHDVEMPETPMYLDALLADTPLLGGFYPELGTHYLAVLGIFGFPGSSQPGTLDALNRLPLEYRWTTRFICLDKIGAKKELESYQRKWFAKRKGVASLIKELITKEESALSDSDAVQKAQDAEQALLELGSDDVSYGYLTTSLVIIDEDLDSLRSKTSELERIINGVGFVARVENVNAVDAWLGTLPGNTRNNVRRPLVNTVNLAHLLPGASAVWGGETFNHHLKAPALLVAETGGSTPFRFSTHVGDVGHSLILGPTGAGKSTLLNFMEVQFLRYPNAQVYIFDKGGSAVTLTAAVGGDYYDLGAEDSKLCFQPLAAVNEEEDINWAHEWLLAIAAKENVVITPEVKRTIWEALQALASSPPEQRTIHALTVYLQDVQLRAAFQPFTQGGPYGKLLDNTTDNLRYGRWQCFEMERLMESPAIIGPVLSYLFYRLSQRFDGSPTLLVLDEAWLFLDHPTFASKIREWLKTLRKQNVSVIFATQSLADVDHSSIAPTVKEACFTKIYLPNAIALQPEAAEFYKRFGLNHRQIEILAQAFPKRDYYYTSPLGNRLFDLSLDELTLAYCSGVSKDQRALIKKLLSQANNTLQFNIEYLQQKGLRWAADKLAQLNQMKRAA